MTMQVQNAVAVNPTTGTSGPGDMGDIAFALAAFQLESLDGDIAFRLGNLEKLTAIKKAYRERINQITELLNGASKDDKKVEVPAGLQTKAEFQMDGETGEVVDGGSEVVGEQTYAVIDSAGKKTSGPSGSKSFDSYEKACEVAADNPGCEVHAFVKKEDLEAEIVRLQGQMDELSGEGEMGLLNINRLMSKRNQVLQLASNILGSEHQTAMGIISNIK